MEEDGSVEFPPRCSSPGAMRVGGERMPIATALSARWPPSYVVLASSAAYTRASMASSIASWALSIAHSA